MSRSRRLAAWFIVLAMTMGLPGVPAPPVAASSPRAPITGGVPNSIPLASAGNVGEGAAGYVGLVPARILDTRDSNPVGPGETLDVVVLGEGGVPLTGVDAVVLNVTATRPTADGWLTVFPAGGSRPLASNLNFMAGQTVPNLVIAKVGDGGAVSVYNERGNTDVVIDVQGWFAAGEGFTSLTPARILDTRDSGPLGPAQTLDVQVLGEGGTPPDGVDAVVLNVTAVKPTQAGWLTVFPAGEDAPLASNLNFVPGQTVPNLVIAKVGADGKVSIRNERGFTGVVIDVQGWFAPAMGYTSLVPSRVLDTRATQAVGAGETLELTVAGEGGVPAAGVDAVVLNVTATRPTQAGWLTVFPAGNNSPLASNLNFTTQQTVPNVVIAKVGDDGKVSIRNERGATHVVVDVQGWFGSGDPVYYGTGSAWRFVPGNLVLAPGESRVVELRQSDELGNDTGSTLPPGVDFTMTGVAGLLDATSLGGNLVRIDAGPVVSTVTVAADVPVWESPAMLTVTIAQVRSSTVLLHDDQILFPQTDLPPGVSPEQYLPPGVDADGVGPFSWEDYLARMNLPNDDLAAITDLTEIQALNYWYPMVMVGDPPAVGSVVLGVEGNAILGTIIEPPGLPTLQSGGYSLVTVQVGGPEEAFLEFNFDLTYDDLVAIGLAPASFTDATAPWPEETTTSLDATPSGPRAGDRMEVDPSSSDPATTPATTAATTVPTTPPTTAPTTPATTDPATTPPTTQPPNGTVQGPGGAPQKTGFGDWARQCVAALLDNPTFAASLAEVQPVVSVEIRPVLDFYLDIHEGVGRDVSLRLGLGASLTVGAKIKVQLQVSGEFACPPVPISQVEMAFPGVLAGVASFVLRGEMQGKFGIKIDGGPRLTFGVSCTFSGDVGSGFHFSGDTGFEALPFHNESKSCSTDGTGDWLTASSGTSSDGVAIGVELGPSLSFGLLNGLRVGGSIAKALGSVVNWLFPSAGVTSDLGLVSVLKTEIGPVGKIVWENATSVLANQDAKSAITLTLDGKAAIELQGIRWFLFKFAVNSSGSEGAMEIPLFQFSLPLLALYTTLKASRFEAKVNDDATTLDPAVYVQEDDSLQLTSIMAPQNAGIVNPFTPQVTEGWLYRQSGGSWVRTEEFGTLTPIESPGAEGAFGTTSLRLTHTIDKTLCDSMRDEPVVFAIVGNAPMGIGPISLPLTPTWGGTFKMQCVDGKMAWDPEEITTIHPGQTVPVTLTTSGAQNDDITISGIPSWLEWTGGTDHVVTANVDGEDTLDFTLQIKDDGSGPTCTRREATIVATSQHRGTKNLHVVEDEKCYVRFDPGTVTGPGSVTSTLHTKGYEDMTVNLSSLQSALPSWLHLTAPTAPEGETNLVIPASDGDEQAVVFTFTVDQRDQTCTDQPARDHEFQVTDAIRGGTVLHIHDPKVDKRTDCGFKFTPAQLDGNGSSTLSLRDDALNDHPDDPVAWHIDESSLPDWMAVAPLSGELTQGGSVSVHFLGTPPGPKSKCTGRGAISQAVYAETTLPNGSTRTATVIVKYPAVAPQPCKPGKPGGSWGDPHMFSFDGARWEGQTLGEFVYTESLPGAPVPFRVVARHQPTSSALRDQSVAPTSITAVSFEYGDHHVEIYGDPSSTFGSSWTVYVDGEEVTVADGLVQQIGEDLSIVRNGSTIHVDAPELSVTAKMYGIIDLTVIVGGDQLVRGMLGSPDDDPSNDFTGSDGTVYDPADIIGWSIPQFYDFSVSWRITDQSLSPFTLQLSAAQFALPSPGFDQELYDTWVDEVDAVLATVSTVCDVPADVSVRSKYAIALELSIGSPIEQIETYLCHYTVQGTATVDGLPVPGLTVTVDGDGFKPCITTTAVDGTYRCMVEPSSAESGGVGLSLPLQLDVVGTWAGRPGTVIATTASFPILAGVDDGPQVAVVDLALDADSVPVLHVTGVALRDGQPIAGSRTITVGAAGSSNEPVGLFTVTPVVDPDTGAYSFDLPLPGMAVSATLTTMVPSPVQETFAQRYDDLVLGANDLVFDVDYVVPKLIISGTATDGVNPLASVTAYVVPKGSGGDSLGPLAVTVTPDPVTGAYSAEVAMPRATASADMQVQVPPYGEAYGVQQVSILSPATSVTVDIVHTPPMVTVSGTMLDELGDPLTGPVNMLVVFRNAIGGTITSDYAAVYPDAGDGSYSFSAVGPLNTVTVEAFAFAGTAGEQFASGDIPVSPGPNAVPLNVALAPVRLHVSGTMVDGAADPLTGPIQVRVYFYGPGSTYLGYQQVAVSPGAGGAYAFDVTGHRNAVSAQIIAFIGVSGEQYEATVGDLTAGDNVTTFDVLHHPPVLTVHGTMLDSATGDPLPGPVNVTVSFRSAAFVVSSTVVAVTPDSVDGSYSFDVVGHHEGIAAQVSALVGQNGETVEADVPVVSPGSNDFLFNVGFSAPIVTLSGTMLKTGGEPLAGGVWLRLRGYDGTDNEVWYQRVFVGIDGNGVYTITRALPAGAVGFSAEAEVGSYFSDWRSTGIVPVVDGNQTVSFDVLYLPVVLHVSGTLTKAPGVPLPGPVQIGVTPKDAGDNSLGYTQPGVTPAGGTGTYEFTVTLPQSTTQVELLAYIGSYGFEQVRQTVTDLVPGEVNEASFSVVHDPPSVTVHGVALVYGAPVVGPVQVTTTSVVPGQPSPFVRTAYPTAAADGSYTTTLVLPKGATSTTVSVKAYNAGANTFTTEVTGLVPNELRDVQVDFDDQPDVLRVSGTMLMFGQPAQGATFATSLKDSNDVQLASPYVTLTLDPDGNYTVDIPLPDGTVRADLSANIWLGSDSTYNYFSFTGLTSGINEVTADSDAIKLELDGTLLDDGSPVVLADPNGELHFELLVDRGDLGLWQYDQSSDYDADTGAFSYAQIIPTPADSAELRIIGVASPDPVYTWADLTGGGQFLDTWDVDLAGSATGVLVVDGVLTDGPPGDGGYGFSGVDTLVQFWSVLPEHANDADPYQLLGGQLEQVTPDAFTGEFQLIAGIPDGTTVVTVAAFVWGNTELPVTRTFFLDSVTGEVHVDWIFDMRPIVGTWNDTIVTDGSCTTPTLVPTYEFWTFTEVPADQTGPPWTWAGANYVGAFSAVPDPVTHEIAVTVQFPQDAVFLVVFVRSADLYDGPFNSAVSWSQELTPGSYFGSGSEISFSCG